MQTEPTPPKGFVLDAPPAAPPGFELDEQTGEGNRQRPGQQLPPSPPPRGFELDGTRVEPGARMRPGRDALGGVVLEPGKPGKAAMMSSGRQGPTLDELQQQAAEVIQKMPPREKFIVLQQDLGMSPEQIEAELGGVEVPWVDPVDAATAGFGAGAKLAVSAGKKILPAMARGAAAAVPAAAMDYGIGQAADIVGEENPEAAFLVAIGSGLLSGITVEQLAEKGILGLGRRLAAKYSRYPRFAKLANKLGVDTSSIANENARKAFASMQAADEAKAPAPGKVEDELLPKRAQPTEEGPLQTPAAKTADEISEELPPEPPRGFELDEKPGQRMAETGAEENLSSKPLSEAEQKAKLPAEEAKLPETGAKLEKEEIPLGGKLSKKPPTDKTRTLRGRIKKMGGINFLNFRGELRDMPVASKFLSKKSGRGVDLVERTLKDEGWLDEGEDLLEVLRDPNNLKRDRITRDMGEKKDWELSPRERELKEQMEWEPDSPPEGDWQNMKAADLPEGKTLTIIEGNSRDGWDQYKVKKAGKSGVLLEDGTTIELKADDLVQVRTEELSGTAKRAAEPSRLYMHPATVTGPIGGIAAGVDYDEETGEVRVDGKMLLAGALAGGAAGVGLTKARKLADKWDQTAKEKIIEPLKDLANGMIVHEDLRHGLGLNRSKELQDALRDHRRNIELVWNKAAEAGAELRKIAPTDLEQKRLMQVLRGGVTASKKMQQKAEQLQKVFDGLRKELKEHKLLEYSRFDKLTRKERAKLRNIISRPKDHNATPDDVAWARQRLHDYYHFASAEEYMPLMYKKHEGLTPHEKQVIQDEIDRLKIQSRRGNPEGKEGLEHLIAQMEAMIGKGRKGRRELQKARAALAKNYSHRREEIPYDLQKMMGRIDEAAFPVAKGLGVQASDILKARLFDDVAKNSSWVRPGRIERPDGTFFNTEAPGANWMKVSDDAFGALDGKWVRRDVWDDLAEVVEVRNFFLRNYDKLLGAWKYGKVVLNPATHARNAMSNLILAYFGDVSPTDIKTYSRAAKSLLKGEKDRFFQEAEGWGLFNNTFVSSEITKLRDELDNLRDPNAVKNWIRKAFSVPAAAYQGNEQFFKLAVFIKARNGGASVDEAARKAEKYLFNYADIPPWVKFMKRWVSPFFTFTYKAIPIFAETAIRRPWKIAAIGGAMYGMEEYSKHALGITDAEAEKQRQLLPDWMQRKGPPVVGPYTHVRMPFKDSWGNDLFLDLAYILPYGNMAEKWGQTPIPLNDLLPSSPLFQITAAYLTNTDPFTGKDIYNEFIDSNRKVAAKYLEYAWREIAPSLAPGGYGFNKVVTGFKNSFMGANVKDWAGRPMDLQNALLSSFLGIKLSPANEKKLAEFELYHRRKIATSIGEEIGKLRRQKEKNEIDAAEYKKKARELLELKKQLLEERPTP